MEKTLKDHKLLRSREPLSKIASGLLMVLLLLSILPVMGQLEQPGPHAALTNSDSILYPSFDNTLAGDLTETRYMTNKQQTVNGLSAYQLGANPQSDDGYNICVVRYFGGMSIDWGIRVWQRFSNGTEIELTNGAPVAYATGLASRRLINATWDCPRIDFDESDSVVVGVYSNGGWGWDLAAKFTTEQLGADYLCSSVWKVCYDTEFTREWRGSSFYGVGTFYYGHNSSRIENFQYSSAPSLHADGFESGNFSAWTGTSATFGETATVVNTMAHHGSYSAMFASNGGGGTERAYCFKTLLSMSELYARGYFYVSASGIAANDNRFYFLIFKAGSNPVAFAGWRQTGGILKWTLLIRDGTGWAGAFSTVSPSLNQWYCVEFYWVESAVGGHAKLWVDGVLVCSITGKNTAYYGDVNRVDFGLAEIVNCGATTTYGDCCIVVGAWIAPIPQSTAQLIAKEQS